MTATPHITTRKGITAQIIRSDRRKTAQVRVDDGQVSILAPHDLSEARIDDILTRKTRWIRSKLSLHAQAPSVQPKEYVSGESFSYLGKHYRLKVLAVSKVSAALNQVNDHPPAVKLLGGHLQVTLPRGADSPEQVRTALTGWYRSHAEARVQRKAARYAPRIGVEPASVGIKTFKSRWGSCHLSGDVLYNWKIVMAPNRIVDYVVVHELCHLKQHDHSAGFWKRVSQVIPDYADCKDWLRVNGRSLEL